MQGAGASATLSWKHSPRGRAYLPSPSQPGPMAKALMDTSSWTIRSPLWAATGFPPPLVGVRFQASSWEHSQKD